MSNAKTSNEKADIFHKEMISILDTVAPVKNRKIASVDQPWYSEPLKRLDRKRKREYQHNRRSKRYFLL